jgi:integrase
MRTRANAITNAALGGKWRGEDGWLTDGGTRGAGRLVARLRGDDGWHFFFQYFDKDDKRRLLLIGPYDTTGRRGRTLQGARDRAAELSALYRGGVTDLHEYFERRREAQERAHKAEQEAARREQEAAQRSTLRQLLDAYTGHLERAGKQSARDAKGIFELHVFDAAPDLADRKAADISVDDLVGLIGKVAEAGKGRTAAKLRSYLRAAYAMAIRSKTDPGAPLTMRAFGIAANPVASIGALSQFNRARDRNLDADELRVFLQRLEDSPEGVKRDAVELALLLGGQRSAQLLRARPVDVDMSAATITLYDRKGARKQPRKHMLPLAKKAAAILRRRLDALPEDAPFVFTSDGKTGMRSETIAEVVTEISDAMVEAKEARDAFQLRDLRKTAETRMAALGVSSDVRAMILSHGLGGVQKRHYDFHDYADEMRAALEKWQRHLERVKSDDESGKVVQLRKRRTTRGSGES